MYGLVFVFISIIFCLSPILSGYSPRLLLIFPTATCEPPRGEICVELRKCYFFDDLLNRTTIPRSRWVINLIRENQCGFANNTPLVCCHKPTPPPVTTQLMTEVPTNSPPMKNKLENELSKHKNFNLLPYDICGPISINSRITSGEKTAHGEFPWMALIVYTTSDGLDFRCGGTVINERYILTAAHCILHTSIAGVRLGEYDVQTKQDCDSVGNCIPPTQDFYVENVIVHPDYNSQTYVNDIALIRLATPANFSYSNVQPVCLPMDDIDLKGKFAIVSGWGVTETGYRSPVLMKVSLPVLSISECRRTYEKSSITSNQICAGGYKGKDSCAGDSGGPLKYVGIINDTPRYVQHGIVSYGPRYCGSNKQPAIYTRVSRYMEWILDNLKPSTDD